MKKWLAILLTAALLFGTVVALADHGTADFVYEGKTYRVYYDGSRIEENQLKVAVGGFGNVLPFRNGEIVIMAWASVVIGGKEVEASAVNLGGDGTYTYTFDTQEMPEKVLIRSYEDSGNAVVLWETGDAEPAAAEEASALPAFLPGSWHADKVLYTAELKAGGLKVTGNFQMGTDFTVGEDGALSTDFSLQPFVELGILPFNAEGLDYTGYQAVVWSEGTLTLLPDGPGLSCAWDEADGTLTLSYTGEVELKDNGSGTMGTGGPADFTLTLKLKRKEEAAIPAELAGNWTGTGTPKNGGSPIALTAQIREDGTGEYTFEQAGYSEGYPFTLISEGNTFTVDIPAENVLGIAGIEGTWALEDGMLRLDITTTFQSGRTYSYTAECTKSE